MVPRLVATQDCVDVPKVKSKNYQSRGGNTFTQEICARSKINPRRIRKPAIQKWCYTIEDDGALLPDPALSPLESFDRCQDDNDCSPGYTCAAEEGKCRARPGKVRLATVGNKKKSKYLRCWSSQSPSELHLAPAAPKRGWW